MLPIADTAFVTSAEASLLLSLLLLLDMSLLLLLWLTWAVERHCIVPHSAGDIVQQEDATLCVNKLSVPFGQVTRGSDPQAVTPQKQTQGKQEQIVNLLLLTLT